MASAADEISVAYNVACGDFSMMALTVQYIKTIPFPSHCRLGFRIGGPSL